MDFRCDCGNGRLPHNCSLLENKEAYENDGNRYNLNYFERYCYCKQPYSGDRDSDQSMIKCQSCENWYHYSHITPSIDDGVLEEDYVLICKTCVETKFPMRILVLYKDFFHELTQDHLTLSSENN